MKLGEHLAVGRAAEAAARGAQAREGKPCGRRLAGSSAAGERHSQWWGRGKGWRQRWQRRRWRRSGGSKLCQLSAAGPLRVEPHLSR
eukprot:scaffold51988_cov59-Phaeocystis_antarctica.AAC.11